MERTLSRALHRAAQGKALASAEVTALLGARGESLDELCAVATRLRAL
jgi:hypothetical protein